MNASELGAEWSPVSDGTVPMSNEARGHAIRRRRMAFGINSMTEFEKATGVSRQTISKAERGDPSVESRTLDILESWLDRFAVETGSEKEDAEIAAGELSNESGGTITYRARGVFGIAEVTVDATPDLADEARRQFMEILAEIGRTQGQSGSSG